MKSGFEDEDPVDPSAIARDIRSIRDAQRDAAEYLRTINGSLATLAFVAVISFSYFVVPPLVTQLQAWWRG